MRTDFVNEFRGLRSFTLRFMRQSLGSLLSPSLTFSRFSRSATASMPEHDFVSLTLGSQVKRTSGSATTWTTWDATKFPCIRARICSPRHSRIRSCISAHNAFFSFFCSVLMFFFCKICAIYAVLMLLPCQQWDKLIAEKESVDGKLEYKRIKRKFAFPAIDNLRTQCSPYAFASLPRSEFSVSVMFLMSLIMHVLLSKDVFICRGDFPSMADWSSMSIIEQVAGFFRHGSILSLIHI